MKLDLLDLTIVLAIHKTKNLTDAAKKIHLTPSAVSYRLKSLEESFATTFFERGTKGMIATSAGLHFIEYCKQIVSLTDNLVFDLKRYNNKNYGRIRLLGNSSTIQSLMKRLSTYLQQNPAVCLDIDEKISEKIIWSVLDDIADIGLIAGDLNTRGLESHEYGLDELVFIAHPKHPINEFPAITFDEALKYEMVALEKNSSNFQFMKELADQIDRPLLIRVHAQSFYSMINCVKNQIGIALCPLSIVENEIENAELNYSRINEPWSIRKQSVIYKKEKLASPHFKSFINFLIS